MHPVQKPAPKSTIMEAVLVLEACCRGKMERITTTNQKCRVTYRARLFQPDCGALEATADNLAWKPELLLLCKHRKEESAYEGHGT